MVLDYSPDRHCAVARGSWWNTLFHFQASGMRLDRNRLLLAVAFAGVRRHKRSCIEQRLNLVHRGLMWMILSPLSLPFLLIMWKDQIAVVIVYGYLKKLISTGMICD